MPSHSSKQKSSFVIKTCQKEGNTKKIASLKVFEKRLQILNGKKNETTHSLGSALIDAALDNVLKSLTRRAIFLSVLRVHLVHFREKQACHLTNKPRDHYQECFLKGFSFSLLLRE